MAYVLKKVDQPRRGQYVAPAGSPKSYTPKLERAEQYATRAAAEANACGNERAVPFNPREPY